MGCGAHNRAVEASAWSAYDEGYLRAYQWASSLAAGAALPQEAPTVQLGPGEVAHAHLAAMSVSGYFGDDGQYQRSFFLFGGPVGLALTGAASLAHNASKKAEAQRAAIPRWHDLGNADLTMTNQRLAASASGQAHSFLYADTGPLQWAAPGPSGSPAVQMQPAGMPPLRLESPWAPLLYVFVHHLLDGRPPAVPLPGGLLDRATAQGRLG
jgi:hypothetical protein